MYVVDQLGYCLNQLLSVVTNVLCIALPIHSLLISLIFIYF